MVNGKSGITLGLKINTPDIMKEISPNVYKTAVDDCALKDLLSKHTEFIKKLTYIKPVIIE